MIYHTICEPCAPEIKNVAKNKLQKIFYLINSIYKDVMSTTLTSTVNHL